MMKKGNRTRLKWALLFLAVLFAGQKVVSGIHGHLLVERSPNPLEVGYSFLAPDLLLPELCEKIAPGAYMTASLSGRGVQISLTRSSCFYRLALRSGDQKYCDRVKDVSTFLLDGSAMSQKQCRREVRDAKPYNISGGDSEWILRFMGYTGDSLGEKDWISLYFDVIKSDEAIARALALPDFSSSDGTVKGLIAPAEMSCQETSDPRWFCYARRCLDLPDEERREACLAIAAYVKTRQAEKRFGRSHKMSGHVRTLLERYPELMPDPVR